MIILFSGCQCNESANLDDVAITTRFHRFDQAFFNLDTANFKKELTELKAEYPMFFMNDGTLHFWLTQRKETRQINLSEKAQKVFANMEQENQRLNLAMKRYYLEFGVEDTLEFYTYISRLDYDFPVIFADSLVFSAIDLYLGKDFEPYRYLPQYLAFEKQPKFLVRDAVEVVLKEELPTRKDPETLLDAMIYHGKLLYALHEMLPSLSEMDLLKYPQDKFQYAQEKEKQMWVYFIENRLLFETSTENQRRFIEVAPFSKFRTQSDPLTPGRIGQWYGYKIVKNYMEENEDLSIQQLFTEGDSQKILRESGYKPI